MFPDPIFKNACMYMPTFDAPRSHAEKDAQTMRAATLKIDTVLTIGPSSPPVVVNYSRFLTILANDTIPALPVVVTVEAKIEFLKLRQIVQDV